MDCEQGGRLESGDKGVYELDLGGSGSVIERGLCDGVGCNFLGCIGGCDLVHGVGHFGGECVNDGFDGFKVLKALCSGDCGGFICGQAGVFEFPHGEFHVVGHIFYHGVDGFKVVDELCV